LHIVADDTRLISLVPLLSQAFAEEPGIAPRRRTIDYLFMALAPSSSLLFDGRR
jgi:hypothetical protein